MRKVFIVIVVVLALSLIYVSFSELETIAETLQRSNMRFLIPAFLFEFLWMYNMAVTFRLLYRLVGLEERTPHLFLVSTAALFVNVVAPSAGIGGVALFVDDAKRRNYSTGRVTVVGALFLMFDYVAFLCVLALGLIVLIRRNDLHAGEITATVILLLIACGLAAVLYLGYKSAAKLGNVLAWFSRGINRIVKPFIHREYLKEEDAFEYAREMAEGLSAIRGRSRDMIMPFLFALNNKALYLCIMALVFLAFGTPFTVGTIVGGFSIGYLFMIVTPTPSGVGIVEGILPVVLKGLQVQWDAAVLITLMFRAITFWFPLVVGGFAFRTLQRQPKIQSEPKNSGMDGETLSLPEDNEKTISEPKKERNVRNS